jgi:hypothetical protein
VWLESGSNSAACQPRDWPPENGDALDTGVYTDTLVAEGPLKKNQQQLMAHPKGPGRIGSLETFPVWRPALIRSKNGKRTP